MEQYIDKNNNYNYNTNIKFIILLKFNCVITLIPSQNIPLTQKESASANSTIISSITKKQLLCLELRLGDLPLLEIY